MEKEVAEKIITLILNNKHSEFEKKISELRANKIGEKVIQKNNQKRL
jgi:hypothetical protein